MTNNRNQDWALLKSLYNEVGIAKGDWIPYTKHEIIKKELAKMQKQATKKIYVAGTVGMQIGLNYYKGTEEFNEVIIVDKYMKFSHEPSQADIIAKLNEYAQEVADETTAQDYRASQTGIYYDDGTLLDTTDSYIMVQKDYGTDFDDSQLFYQAPSYIHSLNIGEQFLKDKCGLNGLYSFFAESSHKQITMEYLIKHFQTSNPSTKEIAEFLEGLNINYTIKDIMGCTHFEKTDGKHKETLMAVANNDHFYLADDIDSSPKFTPFNKTPEIRTVSINKKMMFRNVPKAVRYMHMLLKSIELSSRSIEAPTIVEIKLPEDCPHDMMRLLIIEILYEEAVQVENIQMLGRVSSFTYRDIFVVKKSTCDARKCIRAIEAKFPYSGVTYANQSPSALGNLVAKFYFENQSEMNQQVYGLFEHAPVVPNRCVRSPDRPSSLLTYTPGPMSCYDITKCHKACLLERDEPMYFFSMLDSIEPFTSGEIQEGYYVVIKKSGIKLDDINNFGTQETFRSQVIKKMLKLRVISMSDIKYFVKPSFSINQSKLVDICNTIDNLQVDKNDKKLILNSLIGLWGHVKSKTVKVYMNTSDNMKRSLKADKVIDDFDEFFMFTKQELACRVNNRPIYHDVRIDATFRLSELYLAMKNEKSELYYYNTDCVCMKNSNVLPIGNKPGQYKLEDVKPKGLTMAPEPVKINYEIMLDTWVDCSNELINGCDISDLIKSGKSFRIQGAPGSGKSHSLIKPAKEYKILGLGLSNQIRNALSDKGLTTCKNFAQLTKPAQRSVFDHNTWLIKLFSSHDLIVIDEYTMLCSEHLTLLYETWRRLLGGMQMIFIGDENQMPSIDGGRRNGKLQIVKEMCQNNVVYFNKSYRCNDELNAVLKDILDGKRINECPFNTIAHTRAVNICFTNKKRDEVNKKCLRVFGKKFKKDSLNMFKGVPLIAKNRMDKLISGDYVEYLKCDEDYFYVMKGMDELRYSIGQFSNLFNIGYCSTIHSFQGKTLEGDYNVYEVEKFTRSLAYTAFSRAKEMNQIHVDGWKSKYYIDRSPVTKELLSKHCIYALVNSDNEVFYIGQTNNFERRMAEHFEGASSENDCDLYKYTKEIENKFTMHEIYKCNSETVDICEEKTIKLWRYQTKLKNMKMMKEKSSKPKKATSKKVVVRLLGSVMVGKNEVVYEVIVDGKRSRKKVAYGKKKTLEEAKAICESHQAYFTLHGKFE